LRIEVKQGTTAGVKFHAPEGLDVPHTFVTGTDCF
jgi:hypothetical protein